MKYMLLIYSDEKAWAAMSDGERQSMVGEYMQYSAATKASGHYHAGAPLQPTSTATSVRVRNGKRTVTDGRSPKPANSSPATIWWRPRTWTRRSRSSQDSRGARRDHRSASRAGDAGSGRDLGQRRTRNGRRFRVGRSCSVWEPQQRLPIVCAMHAPPGRDQM